MENLLESLKNYFENTPKDKLDNDWEAIKYLNEIGPDVIEYANFVKEYLGIEVSYSSSDKQLKMHIFDLPEIYNNSIIKTDAQYCLAA